MLVALVIRSRAAKKFPHARRVLIACISSAVLFCAFGTYWWCRNYPEHLTWVYLLSFCIIPGFMLVGCVYGIVVEGCKAIITTNA
jgi:hypothetical protein